MVRMTRARSIPPLLLLLLISLVLTTCGVATGSRPHRLTSTTNLDQRKRQRLPVASLPEWKAV
jgi:outer membrane biogenesis lipoprotein LolB